MAHSSRSGQLILNKNGSFISRNNQTIFDIGLMLSGGLDSIVQFAILNNIESLNGVVNPSTKFTYTNGIAITNWCLKNNYIFANGTQRKSEAIVYITSQTWKDSADNYWLITIDSNNIVSSVITAATASYITSQLWRDTALQMWTITIDTNGIFSPLNSGYGTPLISEFWSNGTGVIIQTIDINGNFQFN